MRAAFDELWRDPPAGRWRPDLAARWREHRRGATPRFVRGIGCAFAALIASAALAGGLLSALFSRAPERALAIGAAAAIFALLLIGTFVATFRRVALRFRTQVLLRRQLLGDVAHELRTPLAILQGRIEGLLDGVYPRDDEQLGQLLEETRHLGRLVEDVGTLASAEAGALTLRKERTDVGELAREVAASFARPIALAIARDVPSLELDPVRIREVLLNLVGNATRYTPAGDAITIEIAARPQTLVLRVVDTGAGIPAEELPHIFERFHKGAESKGSGLGLAIARDLVRAHGGTIRAESRVGQGTTIEITLPR
jgi:signal transduction histidine kinase